MVIEFLGYWSEEMPLQRELPEELARQFIKSNGEIRGLVIADEESPPDSSAEQKKELSKREQIMGE